VVSWKFEAPASDESVAILIPESTPERVQIIAYNLDRAPVRALMTGWDVEPGKWEMTQGGSSTRTIDFERTKEVAITFAPQAVTEIRLRLVARGVPYWSRPDLGITGEDIRVDGSRMQVTVHSLGAVDAPASRVVLRDRAGRVVASASVPALRAPADLIPKTADAVLSLPANADWKGGSVTVESSGDLPEITLRNNRVEL